MVRRRKKRGVSKQYGSGFLAKRAYKKMVKRKQAEGKYKWSSDGSVLIRNRIPSYEEWKKKHW